MLGRLILRERQAAGRLDLADAQRAVRAGARQDHADRVRPLHRGQRPQEVIDRIVRAPIIGPRRDREHAVGDRDAGVRLDDVDVVGRDLGAVDGIDHRHRRVRLEQLAEPALVVRIQVLDDHQREPGPRRQRGEQMRRGVRPPAEAPTPTTGNGCSAIVGVYGLLRTAAARRPAAQRRAEAEAYRRASPAVASSSRRRSTSGGLTRWWSKPAARERR